MSWQNELEKKLAVEASSRYVNGFAIPEVQGKIEIWTKATKPSRTHKPRRAPVVEYTMPVQTPMRFTLTPEFPMPFACSDDTDNHWIALSSQVAGKPILPICGGEAAAIRVMISVADALLALHAAGIAHGTVSADAVLVDASILASVSTVSTVPALLARWPLNPRLFVQRSAPQKALLRLAAPEIVAGREYGAAADVWGLGVLMLQLLKGMSCKDSFPSSSPSRPSSAATAAIGTGPSGVQQPRISPPPPTDVKSSEPPSARQTFLTSVGEDLWKNKDGLCTEDIQDCDISSPFLGGLSPAVAAFLTLTLKSDPARRCTLLECLSSPMFLQSRQERNAGNFRSELSCGPNPAASIAALQATTEEQRINLMAAVRARRQSAKEATSEKHMDPEDETSESEDSTSSSSSEEEEEEEEENSDDGTESDAA